MYWKYWCIESIDRDDIGNSEDLLRIVFIHEECGNLKGIIWLIFCIDVNTHIDRKWKIMQNLLKENYFFKMFKFLLTSFNRYHYHLYLIYSDCMWRHVYATCNSFIFTYLLKIFFSIRNFFCRPCLLLEKIRVVFYI